MSGAIGWVPVSYYFGPGLAATDADGRLLEVVPFARDYDDPPEGYLLCIDWLPSGPRLGAAGLEAAREAAEARIRAETGP